ncbi:MAG: SRPBCC family protein [Acidobacteriota bacterium]
MADILHDLPIKVPVSLVFHAVSTPEGLDSWWTKHSTGQPVPGSEYQLSFGPGFDWRAVVTAFTPDAEFELRFVHADADWLGTRVRFTLEARAAGAWLRFAHLGWPEVNEHYRISCNCWAMYLRVLRRSLEHGERVAYEDRLDV